ncbi:MAG TPA: methyltransferase domain-containing protein [Ramlibacter sp.]|nr:methyltransferase domain-containing protein [Ramlibacter sp.]
MPDPTTDLLAHRRALLATLLTGTSTLPLLGHAQSTTTAPRLDVPYVPTPQEVVDRMLELAAVKPTDTVYDLGCGDGRIVITAAQKYKARGTGIDLNPERIEEAKANAKTAGVQDRVQFRVADLFETDVSQATVVTLYLLPAVNRRLRPQLWKQLQPGTRIVSHAFDMGDEWPPERTVSVAHRTIYTWTIKPEHKRA